VSPASCIRCSRPLPAGSTSGLCPACLSGGDTDRPPPNTSVIVRPAVEPETGTYEPAKPPVVDNRPTVTAEPVAGTAAPPPVTASEPEPIPGPAQPLPPPGYDLIRRLGGGAMGDVFLAREHASERVVAVKFLRSPGSPTAVERFLAEVRALARIKHPHIVTVFATDFYRHQPFFTMEYATGGTLAERVSAGGPFDPGRAAGLIATIARAVHAAHAADVLHRDLKPSNILLAGDGTPRVSDFGLAKLTDRDDAITDGSGALGTPSYMPPEQVSRKHGEIGPAADVYGLGATLYHLLTGRPPFTGDSPAQVTVQVERDQPERPRAIRPEIPLNLEAIVMKCLEKKAANRYPSPGALADDLDKYLAGQPQEALPLTRGRRLRRWVGRNRVRIAGGVAVMLALVAAFLAGYWSRLFPPDPTERIRRELRAGRSVTLVGETGPPRWHNWPLGATALGESRTGDGSCSFETVKLSLLELLNDPGIDRYRVTADIRLLDTNRLFGPDGTLEHKGSPAALVGLYFGRAAQDTADGLPAHFMLAATYNDHLLAARKVKGVPAAAVQLRTSLIVLQPDAPLLDPTGPAGPPKNFDARELPGDWRRVRIDVTPEGVKAYWSAKPGGPMELLADLSAAELDGQYQSMARRLEAERPGLGVTAPSWYPRMPFGVWCRTAAVSVRNVIVEPLPRPE
jgi:serine/threonine-protein kinase